MFRDAKAFALIDFDLAKPATRADEMFNVMLWWAPLFDPRDAEPLLRGLNVPHRYRILADAYGMSGTDRARVIEVAIMRTRRAWYLMRRRAERDGGGWQRMWDEGVGDIIKRRGAWLDKNAAALEAALTAGERLGPVNHPGFGGDASPAESKITECGEISVMRTKTAIVLRVRMKFLGHEASVLPDRHGVQPNRSMS